MSPNLPRPKGPLPLPLEPRPEERTRARSPTDLRRRRGPEALTARRSKENGTLSPPATGKKGSTGRGRGNLCAGEVGAERWETNIGYQSVRERKGGGRWDERESGGLARLRVWAQWRAGRMNPDRGKEESTAPPLVLGAPKGQSVGVVGVAGASASASRRVPLDPVAPSCVAPHAASWIQ